MSDDLRVGATGIALGYRSAAAIVLALVTGSAGGTSIVVSRLAHIEASLDSCSQLPAVVATLGERVDTIELQVRWLAASGDVGLPAMP